MLALYKRDISQRLRSSEMFRVVNHSKKLNWYFIFNFMDVLKTSFECIENFWISLHR